MRMSSSGGTPRKFSEKIAILERKQNEENTNFEDIMRQVRSITHDDPSGPSTAPMAIPQQGTSGGLLPPQPWGHNLGGSLPNVHQMPSYSPPQWPPNWHDDIGARMMPGHRSRSPEGHLAGGSNQSTGHHYHPYGAARSQGRSPDRVPPLHPHYNPHQQQGGMSGGFHNQQGHLVPPEPWNQINRARSDPAIHNMAGMHPMYHENMLQQQMHHQQQHQQQPIHPQQQHQQQQQQQKQQQQNMPHYLQNSLPGPSGMRSSPHQIPSPLQMSATSQMQNQNGMSPLQSPVNHMMHPMYGYQNGSPMQSPMGSPHASSLMLDGSNTPCMELSPPGMHDYIQEAGSLPNLQQMGLHQNPTMNGVNPQHSPQQQGGYYHTPVGPRHSTGTCGPRLVPGPILTPESQSAPTSPHNQLDLNQQPAWPTRTFSNSPEALDIPKLVLTNAEGTPGQHLECFNDLQFQELNLDTNDLGMICNGSSSSSGSINNTHDPFQDHGGGNTVQMLQN